MAGKKNKPTHFNSAPPLRSDPFKKQKSIPEIPTRKRGLQATPSEPIILTSKAERSSTLLPDDLPTAFAPPELPTSFTNSPVGSKRGKGSVSASDSDDILSKMMDFTVSNDFDIYGSDPSIGLPGSSSFLDEAGSAETSLSSFSREQTAESAAGRLTQNALSQKPRRGRS